MRDWTAPDGRRYMVELRTMPAAMSVEGVDVTKIPAEPTRWFVRGSSYGRT